MTHRWRPVGPLLAGLSMATLNAQARLDPPLAIEGVTVVSLDSLPIRSGQTVVIANGRIVSVGPMAKASIPSGSTRIDGRGRYLMAGLADMHAHVTSWSPSHLAWRDSVGRRLIAGPNLVVTTPLLAGTPQRYRHLLISTPREAAAAVTEAKSLGYDALKVYDGLSPEVYRALVTAAEKAKLPVTGHIPDAVGLDSVVGHGQRSIEHTEQILNRLAGHPPDSSAVVAAVDRLVGTGIWVTPTLAVFERLSLVRSAEVQARFSRPEMGYVDSATMAWWAVFKRPAAGEPTPGAIGQAEAHRAVVRRLAARGVPILVGTDTPNPFMVPGFSLHEEMSSLAGAGLARSAILAAATHGAAQFLGQEREFGRVVPGMRADLILTAVNPLEDWSTLRTPLAVSVRGHWFTRQDLDRLLGSVARRR